MAYRVQISIRISCLQSVNTVLYLINGTPQASEEVLLGSIFLRGMKMSRLIDADRLLTDRMKSKYYRLPNGDLAIPLIDIEHAPTVDAEPVRHGHWVRTDKTDKFTWECSECGYGLTDCKLSYCYDCGCKMEEVTE